MAERFDIHKWQAEQKMKQWLAEQEEFTPDLEDDELKRRAIQQMMNTEKGLQKDDYKLVNSISNVAEMYSYGEILDALESFYIKNGEQPYADMARKHAQEFRDALDDEEFPFGDPLADFPELEEANTTGTGASFNAGDSAGYATPNAFASDEDDWEGKDVIYETEEEPAVDDEGNPIEPEAAPEEPGEKVDTASELASKLKSLSSMIKKPAGQKGIDKTEIETLALVLDKIYKNMQDGNASGTLKKILSIIPD